MSYTLLIDGELIETSERLEVIDPASGQVFATCSRANAEQLDQAVAAAKRAFPAWSARSHEERKVLLERLADALEARHSEMARLLTQEQGKPLVQATGEVAGAIGAIRHFAAIELPEHVIRDTAQERIIEQRMPLGVVAAITPWNFPLMLLMLKIGPALSAGNTIVAKPAPSTPLTTALFGEIAADILPPGVFNVIIDANDLGSALTSHPDVAKVSFTGSTATGKRVMASAAGTLKRVTLELGGNDAAIILDDADVATIAPQVFWAAMFNSGQVCLAAKRIYVPESMIDAFCAEFARLASEAVIGDGLDDAVQLGPLQNRQQFERVLDLIEDAKRSGAIVVGGKALDRAGYFIEPTVVRGLAEDSRLVCEEQFGPVFPVLAYTDLDEVIARANDSDFGLGGTIWTSNPERGVEVARRIHSGTVWVNKYLDAPFDIPYGGAKQSGIGREQGVEGMKEFTQAKIINMAR